MTPLKSTFASEYELLQTLRRTDPTFAEICRDYELLTAEIASLSAATIEENRHLGDLQDSLSGLRDELRDSLRAKSAKKNSQET